jgi:hypothetical protein
MPPSAPVSCSMSLLFMCDCPDFDSIVDSSRNCFNLAYPSAKLTKASRNHPQADRRTFACVASLAREWLGLWECRTTSNKSRSSFSQVLADLVSIWYPCIGQGASVIEGQRWSDPRRYLKSVSGNQHTGWIAIPRLAPCFCECAIVSNSHCDWSGGQTEVERLRGKQTLGFFFLFSFFFFCA